MTQAPQNRMDPADGMEKLVRELATKYPNAGLSFGYIGNCSKRWGDDRSWSVFTKIPRSVGFGGSIYWGSYNTDELDQMFECAKTRLEPWIVQALARATASTT